MAGSGQIRQLRRRIRSVKNTQKITRAMEMIAASRILKAQGRVEEARPYAEQILDVIKGLAVSNEVKDHPLLAVRDNPQTAAVVLVTSDRGLAGAYNSNVIKLAERVIAREGEQGLDVKLYLVGRKGVTYFTYRRRNPERSWTGVSDTPEFTDAQSVGRVIMDDYASGKLDRVWLVYTDFKSSLIQTPNAAKLLPVDPAELEGGSAIPAEFMFEPSPGEILGLLIPRYVEAKIFAGMLESSASEHAARQRAMKNATDNADDVITKLSRVMNAARQEQITTEISEIVGGAEALSQGK